MQQLLLDVLTTSKKIDDGFILNELLQAVPLMSRKPEKSALQEETLQYLGDGFFMLVRCIKNYLPDTAIHILSNARNFKIMNFLKVGSNQSP